jgi:hypothetical protein
MYEPTDRVATDHAEQPQDQKNYKNRPKHFSSPPFVDHAQVSLVQKQSPSLEQRVCREFLGLFRGGYEVERIEM